MMALFGFLPLSLRTPFGVDVRVDDWLQAHQNPVLDSICNGLMWIGTTLAGDVLVVLLALAVSVWRRRPGTVPAMIVAVVVAEAIGVAIKVTVRRPRPPGALRLELHDWSFPSTAMATCTAAMVVLLRLADGRGRRWLAAAFGVLALAVGFGVVYLAAHWLTDAIAGTVLGVLVGWVTWRVTDRLAARRRCLRTADASTR